MRTLVIEGWRTSCHSYALVNQQQLLQLLDNSRFRIFHRDVPFYYAHWASIDSGLPGEAKTRLAAIAAPPPALGEDVIYRISFPFRIHAGAGRVFVFATNELDRTLAGDTVGADGRPETADPQAVDVVTPSSWSRRAFLKAGYSPDRVHVIPHGVDPGLTLPLPADKRSQIRASLKVAADAFAFLNIGAMTWNKGIGPLIAAFAIHRRVFPRSVLILKGSDALYGNILQKSIDEAGRLRAEARDSTLREGIRYIPQNLSCEQVARLYRSADAYIAPYRAEGFNLPVLEAMAAGLPVVVTRGGATDDFCPEEAGLKIAADPMAGESGEYLEPRIESIVEQMARIVEESSTRQRLALRGHECAIERYSWSRVTDQLAQLLLT